MKYMGSKNRIAKHLLPIMSKDADDTPQRFTGLTIDMNNVDTFILSEKESDWVTFDTCFFKNTDKGFDVKQLQIKPPIGAI